MPCLVSRGRRLLLPCPEPWQRPAVFHRTSDYEACLGLIAEASLRLPMRVLGYCLMPNHFHLVLWPHHDCDIRRWMHWMMTTHVRRHLTYYHSSGQVGQGRFEAFPIKLDEHLLTVLRYVERNLLRSGLVDRPERWPWSSPSRPRPLRRSIPARYPRPRPGVRAPPTRQAPCCQGGRATSLIYHKSVTALPTQAHPAHHASPTPDAT
jgi:REP element-mobilizing transposase RayT